MNPSATAVCALAAASLVAAAALFQDRGPDRARAAEGPEWVQSELEALSARIQQDVEKLRGAKFQGVIPVKLADKPTLIEYMKRRTEEDTPPERLAADERLAKLLGLIPPGMDLLAEQYSMLESQVGGFYDPPTKTFYLMDSMPKGLAGVILAHELVHALDDQLFDLDAPQAELKDNTDAQLAYHSLIEGSGTAAMNTWMQKHLAEINLSGYEEMTKEQTESLAKTPRWLWRPLIALYLQGACFVTRSNSLLQGQTAGASNEDITHAFRDRPRSTEQVLHPDKYWDPEQRDDPRRIVFSTPQLPEGWTLQLEDTLGELLLALVTSSRAPVEAPDSSDPTAALGMLLDPFTQPAVEGWGGDRLVLFTNGEASWLRLVTVWDTERDAGEFKATLDALLPDLEKACKELSEQTSSKAKSGAELAYGEGRDVVVLTLWAGITHPRDRKVIEDGVSYSVQ
jgi:hypothetical protein